MAIIHCYEDLSRPSIAENSQLFYIMVIVLDAIFGAGTFMMSMGLGITYNQKKNTASRLIKRGITLFFCGYLLNFCRDILQIILVLFAGMIFLLASIISSVFY